MGERATRYGTDCVLPLVFNFDDTLIDRSYLAQAQFAQEALFINAFDKAGPLETVNLNGRADGCVAQLIRFRE